MGNETDHRFPIRAPFHGSPLRGIGPSLWDGALPALRNTTFWIAIVLLAAAPGVSAQQLSLHHYDVADGLASSLVTCIFQDTKGYLWFGAWQGVSRFDGYQFVSYGIQDGLPLPAVGSIAEDAQGHLWFATNAGIARFEDQRLGSGTHNESGQGYSATARFTSFSLGQLGDPVERRQANNRVNNIFFDDKGNMWCGTDGGIFRARGLSAQAEPEIELIAPVDRSRARGGMVFGDSNGRIWANIDDGLVQIVDRRIIKYGLPGGVKKDDLISVWEVARHRLLAAFTGGIYEFVPSSESGDSSRWIEVYAARNIICATEAEDGSLWIGTINGIIKYKDGSAYFYTTSNGLSDNRVSAVMQDREGNIWIGTNSGGLCKLENESMVSFTRREGLPQEYVANVVEDKEGRIYAATSSKGLVEIVGHRAIPVRWSANPPFGDLQQCYLQDRAGYWWMGTGAGIFRSAGSKFSLAVAKKYGRAQGVEEDTVFRTRGPSMYEDPAGVIWISSDHYLYRYDPSRGPPFQAIPLRVNNVPTTGALCFMMDRTGALWVATYGGLFRFTAGQLTPIEASEALPVSKVRSLFLDSRGGRWLGLRYTGVAVIRDPSRQPFEVINYSTATGLASDAVWTITEDEAGRIYLGTERGLDQLDVSTSQVRHFTTAEGLAGSQINRCMRDSHGNIWVATSGGLSRLDPRAHRDLGGPSPIYLRRVQVAGEDLPLPETGTTQIPPIELPYGRNNILIEYAGLSFRGGTGPEYQYRLEGVDADWSKPGLQRSVNYARLGPGKYKFLVRTIDREGIVSSEPASLEFRILPPIWRRWWAISIAAFLLAGALYGIYRYRLNRLLEVERVRTRIATDLHDDIGANLSLIAMSSEVAKRRAGQDPQLSEYLMSIAATSRDLVDSMSDIVWAVNPKKDSVGDLAHRMRGFASDILGTNEILFRFRGEVEENGHRLPTDVRRELFLVFKEGINNAVRHSRATEVDVDFAINGKSLLLQIKDNGSGFDISQPSDGNGLESMRGRAGRLGGDLELVTQPGEGTTLKIRIPIP
jgi:ligand-binding sensor domain-containing protein/two-component sensor histidine kinase